MEQLTFRLKEGQLLKEEIEKRTAGIKAGALLAIVASLHNANLRMAGATGDEQVIKEINGPLEIVSGTGTISKDGCHIHISVSDKEGVVLGGHLRDGCRVDTTAEIVVGIFNDVVYRRVFDAQTGFKELDIQ